MKSKKILFIFIFAIFILFLLAVNSNASLYLNNLDFYAEIDKNGDMHITETWDIDVADTNTLYKTFNLDNNKYGDIVNVIVSEEGRGNFLRTNTWAYHLDKDYYFGGINDDGNFEIAWGVGLDDSSATKKYYITYTVIDAITKYNDCTELYWQFIGDKFKVDAKKITGTIKLPAKANSKEDIRVWGHVETLNGEIYATSNNTVEFSLNNYSSGNYVEVRVAMPTQMLGDVTRTYNKNMLNNIIQEETEWANEANARRKINNIIIVIGIVIVAIIILALLKKTIKYIKILKSIKKMVPTEEILYYREKPNNFTTPGDALFLYNDGVLTSSGFGKLFSATLLNLNLKGYFKILIQENDKGKESTVIYKSEKSIETLQDEEQIIARFVKIAIGANEKITVKELQKFIKKHPEDVSKLIKNVEKSIKNKNKLTENFDEKKSEEKSKYMGKALIYIFIGMFALGIAFPVTIVCVINAIILFMISNKISELTQKGIDEKAKWKGLKNYMEEFSLLNEREIPELEIWEEYLVFATVFGIADKVIKQLKMIYPQIEEMDNFNTTSYVYMMSHTDFNSSFSSAINSSISSTMSSGSGRRRRIFWRRRWRSEDGGRRTAEDKL